MPNTFAVRTWDLMLPRLSRVLVTNPDRQLLCHFSKTVLRIPSTGELPALLIVCGFLQGASGWAHPVFVCAYFFRIRIAFRTAMIVTPTSPNTASHIPAMPSAPRTRNTLLIPRAITMFCITIRFVAFATSMASTSFDGSSVIRTTSAASIAASEPSPPMAMPTSARARTGASLMPSPTKASLLPCRFCLSSISSFSTFWSGKSCA